jgi:hypothetical protein
MNRYNFATSLSVFLRWIIGTTYTPQTLHGAQQSGITHVHRLPKR